MTIGAIIQSVFFAPDLRLFIWQRGPGQQAVEFKSMVKALHAAGIEVILDVSTTNDRRRPSGAHALFRGIDNPRYYRVGGRRPRYYVDFTGCGNTLNMRHPRPCSW